MRRACIAAAVVLATLLAACGDDAAPKPAAGSPENPLVAQTDPSRLPGKPADDPESAASGKDAPGYQELVAGQTSKPKSRFTPCSLVSKAQARTIVGKPVADPLEAPLGPTCIYRSDKADLSVTLAVQPVKMSKLKPQLEARQAVDLAGRSGYCGYHGEAVLYVPVDGGRVLSVAAPCDVAKKFALAAVQELH